MASVADLADDDHLLALVDAAVLEQGTADAEAGAVQLTGFSPLRLTATVAGDDGEVCQVELRSDEGGLAWRCTCEAGAAGAFCRHAVATARETWRQAPRG